ncbi:thiamine phosphate synthase [Aminipila terrae]|uniref:thiamine phosphate synthase n=1 Tax=Aminipila terrae TaxID=2697030 RepID=UPI002ED3BAB5
MDFEEFLQEALKIKQLCSAYNVPFIVNDNVSVAIKCNADGIHVGQSDMEASHVRDLIGENMILGVSVQTVEQALAAEKRGADYLGVGTIFTTSTKPDADFVSLDTLKAICKQVSIPVVAIGGIGADNISQLQGTAIAGVALVSAIFASENIQSQSEKLRELSERVVKK